MTLYYHTNVFLLLVINIIKSFITDQVDYVKICMVKM